MVAHLQPWHSFAINEPSVYQKNRKFMVAYTEGAFGRLRLDAPIAALAIDTEHLGRYCLTPGQTLQAGLPPVLESNIERTPNKFSGDRRTLSASLPSSTLE